MAKDATGLAATRLSPGDDLPLVERARAGDMTAFSQLVLRYQNAVVNLCWRVCGDRDEAQDLAQEAFIKALQALPRFQQNAAFYTWLFRIAVNLSISARRKSARRVKLSLHGADGRLRGDLEAGASAARVAGQSADPPAQLASREMQQLVLDGLDALDDDQRAIIVLKDIEGLDYAHIAEVLEVPVGTVKSRLHRARMELRDRLKRMVGE